MLVKCPNCGEVVDIPPEIIEREVPIYCPKCYTEMHHKDYPLKKGDLC